MFREIRTRETINEMDELRRKIKEEGYKKIKPETNMTIEEMNNFINNLFNNLVEEA